MDLLLHTAWSIKPGFVGGTERFLINLAKGINKLGHNAYIVCSNPEKKTVIETVDVFGSIPSKYLEKIDMYGSANELFFKNEVLVGPTETAVKNFSNYVSDQIRDFDYELLHFNSFVYSAFIRAESFKMPAIVTNHEVPEEMDNYWGEGFFNRFASLGQSSHLMQFGRLFVPSSHYANQFSRKLNVPVQSIPLGIDVAEFSGIKRNFELRKEYCNNDSLLILLPSRFDINQKGHDIAIDTVSILRKKGIDVTLLCSGYDSDAYSKNISRFNQNINMAGVEDSVFLTKFEKMSDAYGLADIVISPERFCSYGLAISESLALGIPTVLSPIPTYFEIAKGYGHAHFSADMSPASFATQIIKLIEAEPVDPLEVRRFREMNSFDKCVSSYLQNYVELNGERN